MRRFVISCLKIILDIGFWLTTLGGVSAGYMAGVSSPAFGAWFGSGVSAGIAGALLGLVAGFLAACLMFGILYLLFQIEENTRRGGEFFEVLGRRMQAREGQAPADTPQA